MKPEEHIGERYARWTIIGAGLRKGNTRYFLCRCDCGTEKHVHQGNMRNGSSKACSKCAGRERGLRQVASTDARLAYAGINVAQRRGRVRLFWCATPNCGKLVTRYGAVCRLCLAERRTPRKYPVSLGVLAQRYGVSQQRVQQVVKKHGWHGMLRYFENPREERWSIGMVKARKMYEMRGAKP